MVKCVDCRQMSEEDPDKMDKEEQKSDSANADPSVKKPAAWVIYLSASMLFRSNQTLTCTGQPYSRVFKTTFLIKQFSWLPANIHYVALPYCRATEIKPKDDHPKEQYRPFGEVMLPWHCKNCPNLQPTRMPSRVTLHIFSRYSWLYSCTQWLVVETLFHIISLVSLNENSNTLVHSVSFPFSFILIACLCFRNCRVRFRCAVGYHRPKSGII